MRTVVKIYFLNFVVGHSVKISNFILSYLIIAMLSLKFKQLLV